MRFSRLMYPTSRLRVWLVVVALASCVAFAFAGCAASSARQSTSAPVPTPTVAATPTLSAAPKVIFRADWAHGTGIWKLPPHWSIQRGALVSDGQTRDNLPVPYTVTATNYRILMTARVVDVTYERISCNNYFGILAQDIVGARMFAAESACFGPLPYHGQSQLYGTGDGGKVFELIIGSNARTYRVDVYGNSVVYYPGGGGSMGGIGNARPNSPAHLFIEASQVKLVITSFIIMTI